MQIYNINMNIIYIICLPHGYDNKTGNRYYLVSMGGTEYSMLIKTLLY